MARLWWSGMVNAKWCDYAATLLLHVNILLALYGGAALATAARLKWDPSTYVAVRELFPLEYRVLAGMLTAGGAMLLLLPQLVVAALRTSRQQISRVLLYIYAGLMTILAICEVAFVIWVTKRIMEWLLSDTALLLLHANRVYKFFEPVFNFIGRLHPLPQHLNDLRKEAEQDAPRNLYVLGAAAIVFALLQPLSILLALAVACLKRLDTHTIKCIQKAALEKALSLEKPNSSLHRVPHNKRLVMIPARAVRTALATPPYHSYEEIR